jgi:NADPH:quinone reductase-like Zn-dependent oxidoreductase
MRAVFITRHGGPEVLQTQETADPFPRPGEVRVRVKAAGLNFSDVMARQGMYPDAPKPPCVVGYEAAGVVDALGAGVTTLTLGTRVLVLCRFGAHAELVCAPAPQVVPLPDRLGFEEAAAIPVNYLTAYHMLFRLGGLRKGDRVLVHMAAGGVGLAALQLCRTVDGVVTFGTASISKHGALKENGCTHPLDYRTKDYEQEVWSLTRGEGVDIVLDALGGRDWRKGYRLLRPVGRLMCFGFANMITGDKRSLLHAANQAVRVPLFNPWSMMNENRTVSGVNLGHLWNRQDVLMEEMAALMSLWHQGYVRPRVDVTFPFSEAALAHQHIQHRKNVGKVVLVP